MVPEKKNQSGSLPTHLLFFFSVLVFYSDSEKKGKSDHRNSNTWVRDPNRTAHDAHHATLATVAFLKAKVLTLVE